MTRDLPVGTVTFVFTDVEGSTRLIETLGEPGYAAALAEQRRVLRRGFGEHGGVEIDTQGDAFFYVFTDAREAVAAAGEVQAALADGPMKVRMGLHTGRPRVTGEGYVGRELHRAARIAASGHGGQVVVSAATAALVSGELTELGEHRLKDFPEPVALFQLGHERFPPLKTVSNTNLPRPASSFVGREREVEELTELLQGARLVTVAGPGGSGKTRLAIEAASALVPSFKAGVFWVPLASLRDPGLVTSVIAETLGASDGVAQHIGERELLLLLDNFEQVVNAASELRELLERCPNLKLLVTSRELLRIAGEVEYPVSPLAREEAVELFCERAQREPSETIAELCGRLDNLPLALELAAARVRVLSPAQILERVSKRLDLLKGGRDAEARQQTLRAAIEWSHDLLDEEEQRLFARLAVFAGGCTLEAAEDVAEADLDVLQSLVDKSLVRHSDERFWMLETIREYALERLTATGEADDLRNRHARYFLALVDAPSAARTSAASDPTERVRRLHDELDNLRAARDEFRSRYESELELRLATAVYWELWERVAMRELRFWLESALERAADADPAVRADALAAVARTATNLLDRDAAVRYARESLALARARGDGVQIESALRVLSLNEQDLQKRRLLLRECEGLALEHGDRPTLASIKLQLGRVDFDAGAFAEARAHLEQAAAVFRDLDLRFAAAHVDTGVAATLLRQGDAAGAAATLERALREAVALEAEPLILGTMVDIAAARLDDEPAAAARLLAAACTIAEERGHSVWSFMEAAEVTEAAEARLGNQFESEWSSGAALTLPDAVALALDSPR